MRRQAWSVLPGIFVALTLAILGNTGVAAQNSRWGANYFPNVTLTTQDGTSVKFYDDLVKGKIVVIDLIYTTCKYACPLETARLAQVQKLLDDRMGKDVFFYSITIDPEHDTPAVLKEYAEKFHAGPGWLFLTGKAEDIETISRKIGLYSEPNPANKDGHAPSVIIGNEATGQWMRNSALDNPGFLANVIGDWMNSWKTAKPGRPYSEAKRLTIDEGQYGFSRHCAPCHTIGAGVKIGPDLAGVTKNRDRDWLARFIVAPQRMLAEGDPTAVALFDKYKPVQMPNLSLSESDVTAIIGYLDRQDAKGGGQSAKAASEASGAKPSADSPPVARVGRVVAPNVTPMIDPYLRIQEALSADAMTDVARNARAIAAAAAASEPSQPIRAASLALATAGDIATARTAFGALGDAIMAVAETSNTNLGQDVRIAYCPMARKYWLQKGEQLRNPFYGKAMLDCGRFVSQISDGLARSS